MTPVNRRLNRYIRRMAEDMQLRNLGPATIDAYTYDADKFCQFFRHVRGVGPKCAASRSIRGHLGRKSSTERSTPIRPSIRQCITAATRASPPFHMTRTDDADAYRDPKSDTSDESGNRTTGSLRHSGSGPRPNPRRSNLFHRDDGRLESEGN